MTTYLLLPGSDGRSSVWGSVAGVLQSAGEVTTYEGWSPAGLTDQVAEVLSVCQAKRIETLVTWSYSGLVGTLVAASCGRLRRLVHIDALLPGFAEGDHELRRLVSPAIVRMIGQDWPLAIAPAAPRCPVEYLECHRRPAKPSFRAIERSAVLAHELGFTVRGLDADHRAMVSSPSAVVSLLQEASSDDARGPQR